MPQRVYVQILGFALTEVVAIPFAQLAIFLNIGLFTYGAHTARMPKRKCEVHPLLSPIRADRAINDSIIGNSSKINSHPSGQGHQRKR